MFIFLLYFVLGCTPCPAQLKLSHPTKCNLYLLCNHFSLSWEEAKCSAHAYFNGVDRCQAATISNRTCPYDITAVANLDIQDVRKCAVQGTDPPTVTAGTRPQNGTGGTKASVVPTKPGGVIATTPLAQGELVLCQVVHCHYHFKLGNIAY